MSNFLNSKKFILIASYIGLYLVASGVSWIGFTLAAGSGPKVTGDPSQLASAREKIQELPKTEECPINGQLYSTVERDIWESRRPIAAMIENHVDSRPQSGLTYADVIYELVAEGGITRFLGIYYCGAAAESVSIAPVRSARIYFVNYAAGYGDRPIFAHVGGANNICSNTDDPSCLKNGRKLPGTVDPRVMAIEELVDIGWRVPKGNDFDTTYDSGFPVFWRNYERLGRKVATEHTMMSSTDKIYEQAVKRGFTNVDSDGNAWDESFDPWKFADDSPVSTPEYSNISFEFWRNKPDYDVRWDYDATTNLYKRINGGSALTDLENGEQLTSKNVVMMFISELGPVDKELHMFYETIGSGEAIIFNNGTIIEGTWEKDTQTDSITFFDQNGEEIEFVRGRIWIEGVPIGNEIVYN